MADNTLKGILGLVLILAATGTANVFYNDQNYSQEQIDHSYMCPTTGEYGIFYGDLSSTKRTAYPHAENRTQSKSCTGGWVKINFIPRTQNQETITGTKWECGPEPAPTPCRQIQ